MQLNSSTDYAVRIIIYLGKVGRLASAKEIAQQMHIPPKYVTILSLKLKDAGLLISTQGNKGGYELSEKAMDATLLDIINLMEGQMLGDKCTVCTEACQLYSADTVCPVNAAYQAMQEAVKKTALNIEIRKLVSGDSSKVLQ